MVACVEVTQAKVTEPSLVNVPLPWFNFILGLNFFPCFKLIIILDLTQKQKKIKFKLKISLKHNSYQGTWIFLL